MEASDFFVKGVIFDDILSPGRSDFPNVKPPLIPSKAPEKKATTPEKTKND